MSILFVNGSPNKEGKTASFARILLAGQRYETLNLVDYKIYAYGQTFEDDQFFEVLAKLRQADTVVMGSPLYWHNICGHMRNFLDRCFGPVQKDEFSGKRLYFIMQGGNPQPWMLEACEFSMKRFAALYGFDYKGMATNLDEAEKLNQQL